MGLCIQSSLICTVAGEPVFDVRTYVVCSKCFYSLQALASRSVCRLKIKLHTYITIVFAYCYLLGVFAYRNDIFMVRMYVCCDPTNQLIRKDNLIIKKLMNWTQTVFPKDLKCIATYVGRYVVYTELCLLLPSSSCTQLARTYICTYVRTCVCSLKGCVLIERWRVELSHSTYVARGINCSEKFWPRWSLSVTNCFATDNDPQGWNVSLEFIPLVTCVIAQQRPRSV